METSSAPLESQTADTATVDAVVVGAGFAGMYMLYRLRELGLTARVIEAGDDVGGTWYWNRYPGARCDVESLEYQYSFSDALQREWNWTERYAQQPEILEYASHVADRFDLRRDIQFNTRVTAAAYDDARQRWIVETDAGDRLSAQFCIMATGCLSKPKWPEIAGRESFRGEAYHTARWPHEGVDFAGKRVGVIGTGSTAVQAIPRIAEQAAHVTVFQRTPNFSVPAKQEPHEPAFVQQYKDEFQALRRKARRTRGGIIYQPPPQLSALEVEPEERERLYAQSWEKGAGVLPVFTDLLTNEAANETAASFIRSKVREIVHDPAEIAAALCPTNHPYGTKRPCLDTDYYETYNRDNVRLVDVRKTPIETITPAGLRTRGRGRPGGRGLPLRHARLRLRLRRDDRGDPGRRYPRAGGPVVAREVGRRAAHLPGTLDRGFPQPVHDHRPGQPLGAGQHDRLHRAARGLDRGLHRAPARAGSGRHRGDAGGGGRLGRSRQRTRRPDALPARRFLVRRGQRARQAAGLHALRRRAEHLRGAVRGGRRQRLRGLRARPAAARRRGGA